MAIDLPSPDGDGFGDGSVWGNLAGNGFGVGVPGDASDFTGYGDGTVHGNGDGSGASYDMHDELGLCPIPMMIPAEEFEAVVFYIATRCRDDQR